MRRSSLINCRSSCAIKSSSSLKMRGCFNSLQLSCLEFHFSAFVCYCPVAISTENTTLYCQQYRRDNLDLRLIRHYPHRILKKALQIFREGGRSSLHTSFINLAQSLQQSTVSSLQYSIQHTGIYRTEDRRQEGAESRGIETRFYGFTATRKIRKYNPKP